MAMRHPRGDGHPMLLLPGFMGSEGSLIALERFLRNRGYTVETWGLWRNVGFHAKHASALEQRIRFLPHQTGRKVSLMGWSLAGLFAVQGAHQVPDGVRCVAALGGPVAVDPEGSAPSRRVKAMYRRIAHPVWPAAHTTRPRARRLRRHVSLPMSLSCLCSLSDGVVPPKGAAVDGLGAACRTPGATRPEGQRAHRSANAPGLHGAARRAKGRASVRGAECALSDTRRRG